MNAYKRITGTVRWRDGFWFRIRGYGLMVHRRSTHKVLYTERYGGVRWHYVGPLCWRPLTPAR